MTVKRELNFQNEGSRWLGPSQPRIGFLTSNGLAVLLFSSCLLLCPTASFAQMPPANHDSWSVSGGAGIISTPTYLGDDDYQLMAFPDIQVRYGDKFEASLRGITYKLLQGDGFIAGPVARYQFERPENGNNEFAFVGDDTSDLVGLGDVEGTIELGGLVGYETENTEVRIEIRKGVNGHEGIVGKAEAKYKTVLNTTNRPVFFSIGPLVTYGNNSYNSAYFDVNSSQSVLSGLSEFDADRGLNTAGLETSILYPLTQKTSLIVIGNYERLLGDVAKSSLVRERGSRNQVMGGILLNYRF